MLDAGVAVYQAYNQYDSPYADELPAIWSAMLDAAPSVTLGEVG
jgi:hypothetical protein